MKYTICFLYLIIGLISCTNNKESTDKNAVEENAFQRDVVFLKQYTPVIILENSTGEGKVALSPALQGRVMTSSANGVSYGWINKNLFESGDTSTHINAFGGEERFWIGPEGGQFSVFFKKGVEFNLDNWYTPRVIDLEPFDVVSTSKNKAAFKKSASLTNYSGTSFEFDIEREVVVLESAEALTKLEIPAGSRIALVAYRTNNSIKNTAEQPWSKRTGILSIWMLGMLNHSPTTTIVVPFKKGDERTLGPVVKDDYFGKIPPDRLMVDEEAIFFKADGKYRSKIGLSRLRATNRIGSYDSDTNTLTILEFDKPEGVADYVNAAWEIQDQPFKGDVINAYNDGPPAPGKAPMGPFYELESSSPAVELKAGERLTHVQTTYHFQGDQASIDQLAKKLLGVSLQQITGAFKK